jgi:hypothetical protein
VLQGFILRLAPVFEAAFPERVTSSPHANQSPFIRFVQKVFKLVAERVPRDSEAITLPADGADHEAAQLLKKVRESQIADDIRRKIYAAFKTPRAPEDPAVMSTGEIISRLRR